MSFPHEIERSQRNVLTIRIPMERRVDWESWFLLSSDRHWDNPKSDHELQKAHLEQALEKDAGVLDLGDLFCAMQGKYDKRSNKSDVRPEHQDGDYLDSLVSTAADFFEPYATHMLLFASGNHEDAIRQRHETNLAERLVARLRDRVPECQAMHGGYSGFVRFLFHDGQAGGKYRQSINLHYSHGHGGGGPVTKGVIQTNRRATYLPDAHIVCSGHIHEEWQVTLSRLRLGKTGRTHHDEQLHVCLPTYKEEYIDGASGWHARRGAPPKPIGAAWLRFSYSHKHKKVDYEVRRAR